MELVPSPKPTSPIFASKLPRDQPKALPDPQTSTGTKSNPWSMNRFVVFEKVLGRVKVGAKVRCGSEELGMVTVMVCPASKSMVEELWALPWASVQATDVGVPSVETLRVM